MKPGEAANVAFIEPMKALAAAELPVGDWLYELKFDGYRALAFKAGKEARLISRNRTNFDNDYPLLIDALKSLTAKQATIDGEIAALDEHGRASFQLLQSYGKAKRTPLVYYAFDLLLLDGADLRSRPLVERRKHLARLLNHAPPNIRFSAALSGTREELLQLAQKFHLEGLIAKRPDSLYEACRRSGAWVKVKRYHESKWAGSELASLRRLSRQEVSKEVVGIHALLTHSLFGDDILHRLPLRMARSNS
jgi:bifunctional non-homologous end joining protein LigD